MRLLDSAVEITVEAQAEELRNIRNNVICQRCNNETPPWSTVVPDSGPADHDLDYPTTPDEGELSVKMEHSFAHRDAILCLNFSQDGKYLAAGCQDGKVYVYDVDSGTLIW